jgi:hypothetical protein
MRNCFLYCLLGCSLGLYYYITRTIYRVFILRCEYPMRPFSFCVYKGNEKMGIRKTVTGQGNILTNKGNERMGIQK